MIHNMKPTTVFATALMSSLLATTACTRDQRDASELVADVRRSKHLSAHVLERLPVAQQEQLLGAPGSDRERVRALVAPNDLELGRKDAPVVLIGFVDLADPDGGRAVRALLDTQLAHPEDVRVVLKVVAAPNARLSQQGAVSVTAATAQGKGWELALCVAALGTGATDWGVAACAVTVGVDASRYDQDLSHAAVHVSERAAQMRKLAVARTPTLFLNGYRIKGVPPSDVLERGVAMSIREATTYAGKLGIGRAQVYSALMRTASVPDEQEAAAAASLGTAVAGTSDPVSN